MPYTRKTTGPWPAPRYDWDQVDWSRPDVAIARQLGCTKAAVGAARRRLGIAPSVRRPPNEWTASEIAPLGVVADREVAARIGRSFSAVRSMRLKLGIRLPKSLKMPRPTAYEWETVDWTRPIQAIADALGCSVSSVNYQKRRRRRVHTRRRWRQPKCT